MTDVYTKQVFYDRCDKQHKIETLVRCFGTAKNKKMRAVSRSYSNTF